MTICVIGLGYVGLTLGVTLADVGFNVVGVEINREIVKALNKGISHIKEPNLEFLLRKHLGKRLKIVNEVPESNDIDTYIIAVATPINEEKKPVNDYVKNAVGEVAERIKKGDLVIMRSTVVVGTTRNLVAKVIQDKTGLRASRDFSLVFAPERTAEGVALMEVRSLPQIIGGIDVESVNRAANIFRRVTNTVVRVPTLEAAEVIKLFDNVYRDVNIALGNEFGKACEKFGLNAYQIIEAANMNYKRNKIMYPGSGVGGGCLTKDPYVFLHSLGDSDSPLVRLAREINENMPMHVISLVKDAMNEMDKKMGNSKIFILGFAFKGEPETADTRFSPTIDVCKKLKKEGSVVYGYDPVVPTKEIREIGAIPCTLRGGFKNADCVVVMNNHKAWKTVDLGEMGRTMNTPSAIIDGWGIFDKSEVERLGMIYKGVGVG